MGNLLRLLLLPIVFVVGRMISWIYRLLFRWWLDNSHGRKADARFSKEIREQLSFLFTEYGAGLGPTEGRLRRIMDSAYATVEAGNLRLQFVSGRGDLTVRVAPKHAPSDWHELSLVAMVIETPQGIGPRANCPGLNDVAILLRSHWDSLNHALSIEQYPVIRKRLDGIYDLSGDDLWRAGIRIPGRTSFSS